MVPDAPNWFFSASAFISFVLCMIPLPWHLQAWNTGTCLFMIWTGLGCLTLFIDSVVWNSDANIRAPIWCDISTHFLTATAAALPASTLCINRRLYKIASIQSVTTSHAQKRRDIIIDLVIGVALPILMMILHTVVHTVRFVVLEEIGCLPSTFNTPLSYVLFYSWPVIIGLVSATYCIRSIRELAIRRAQFKEFLSANGSLSSGRYFRLMGLAAVDVLFTVPLAICVIFMNVYGSPVVPFGSWAVAHANDGYIVQLPAAVWRSTTLSAAGVEMTRWFFVFNAVLFFALFGFADEAKKNYWLAYVSVAKRVGLSTGSVSATGTRTANGTNPGMSVSTRFTEQMDKKHDSTTSFSRLSLPDHGGALAEVKKVPFSPTSTSSGSISKESLPRSPVDIDNVPLPTHPKVSLHMNAPPRYDPDAPNAV